MEQLEQQLYKVGIQTEGLSTFMMNWQRITDCTSIKMSLTYNLYYPLYLQEQQRLRAMMDHLKKTQEWHEEDEREEVPDSPGSKLCLPLLSSTSSNR